MKTERFLTAAIFIAIASIFFACTSDDGGSDFGVSSVSNSSSSSNDGGDSSCIVGSFSNQGQQGGGCINPNATINIGGQTWLKCNLNVPHSEGKGDSWCYGDEPDNCAEYGRLYNWAAAMNLPSECNSIFCAYLIDEPHQGICPQGFHIPTNKEWDELYLFADGTSGTDSPYSSPTAGSKLKAVGGWNSYDGISSTDEFGFSALPGGTRSTDGCFDGIGDIGTWWSASDYEYDEYGAYVRNMGYIFDNANYGIALSNSVGFSVRCVQD
jgi:uncharacterized protein (TIGR02145 family)